VTGADAVPVLLGACLIVAAAVFALLPLLRPARASAVGMVVAPDAAVDRFQLYRNVLELEFDYETGKLSAEDYAALSGELLGQAADQLREVRGRLDGIDDEIEREIAAARAAFASARGAPPSSAATGQPDVAR